MWVVGWIGLFFELLGIGIALWGLDQLSDELFFGSLPHKRLWRWSMRKLGIKPKPANVVLGTATVALGGDSLRASGTVTKPRPSDGSPLAEWNAYWDSRLDGLSHQIDWLRQDMKQADNDLGERLKAERAERYEVVARLEERLKVVVGGEGGSGLVKTWWGLALTAVGALLQGLAQGLS